MKYRTALWLCILVAGGALLTGCMSLAGDVTPPPSYVTPQVAVDQPAGQPAEVSTVFPIVPPDPAAGAETYATECSPCHGAGGRGGGSMSQNLPEPPPEIGSAELARVSRPSDWFLMVTNGNLEKLMPGFKGSLDDRSRWDVVAYVYTLSTTPEELAVGKSTYEAECASCHGADGRGDGQDVPDLTDQERMAQLSGQAIEAVVAAGQGSMPAFGSRLSESERWATVSYVRALTFTGAEGAPVADPETQPQAEAPGAEVPALSALVIRGEVTTDSGSTLPEVITVTLYGFEGMNQAFERTADGSAGAYEFTEVPYSEGMAYLVQVTANGYSFNSDILHAADITGSEVDLPVSIYDTTTDASGLTVDRMHVFFDFSIVGKIQVVELFIVSNPTDKVVIPAAADQPSITFGVPEGAVNLTFDSGELGGRFLATEDGFGEMSPIPPGSGQHQVLYSFELPYEKKLALSLPVKTNVASAIVMLPPGGVKLQSEQLEAAGQRSVQGMAFDLFTASNLTPGSSLDMQLSGKIRDEATTTNTFSGIAIGGTIFGLALIGTGIWMARQRKFQQAEVVEPEEAEGTPRESEEAILDAILALDDLFQAGNLPQEAYTERRAALKDRLRALRASNAGREGA